MTSKDSDPDPRSPEGARGEPETPEEGEPAPARPLHKLILTAAPFVALLLLFLLDRCVIGR